MFFLPAARSDRYTHDFVSDEEDGDDEAFQSPFENFASMTPRFSAMLGQHQLSFDEESEPGRGGTADAGGKKKSSMPVVEPKHEKRDSGIAGLEENAEIKILEERKLNLLGSSEDKGDPAGISKDDEGEDDDDVETEGEGAGEDGGDTTEDEEGVITNIDDAMDEQPVAASSPAGVVTSTAGEAKPTPPAGFSGHMSRDHYTTPSPPITPTRPVGDHRPPFDHTHSAPAGTTRVHSEHAQSPLSSSMVASGIASRFKRKTARMEDMSQLTMATHDLDITVSPPTPGKHYVHIFMCIWSSSGGVELQYNNHLGTRGCSVC